MTDAMSEQWRYYAASIFSTGLHVLLAVGLLLVAILAVRKHRRDVWGLFLGSAVATLVLAVATPLARLWMGWQMRSHGVRWWLQRMVYLEYSHALVSSCATVLLLVGIVKLARAAPDGAARLEALRAQPGPHGTPGDSSTPANGSSAGMRE